MSYIRLPFTFSFKNAYWMCNWVSNMVYFRYNALFPELKAVRDRLENDFTTMNLLVEKDAESMNAEDAAKFLSDYSHRMSGMMTDEWMQLAQRIIVKYNDMVIKKTDSAGNYLKTPGGEPDRVIRPGYPEEYRRAIVRESGDKYLSR